MISIITLRNISKTYEKKSNRVCVLENTSLSLNAGDLCALVAPSGNGKSTLLHMMGLIDTPSDGRIEILGSDVSNLSSKKKALLRNSTIGFIYQFHHLLPEFSALENVMFPLLIANQNPKIAKEKALHYIEKIGLSHRTNHKPQELSGGEQQRIAIARALINNPKLLLADEPTGNLDNETGKIVFNLLLQLVEETKLTCFIATHNKDLAKKMGRFFTIKNKQCIEIKKEDL